MSTDAPFGAGLPGIGSFLDAIADGERRRLLGAARRQHYELGETILIEGESSDEMLVVLTGRVKISRVSAEGREQVLRYVPAGGSFNEVPVFDGGPNPASATAAEPSDLLVISREQIQALMKANPEIAEVIIQSLASRLRHLVELVEDLSFRQVTPRVARVLLQSVAPHPGVGAGFDGSRRFSQRELAEMVGTSREVVARALRTLEDAGAIAIERGAIRIVDASLLDLLA
jgi:CRP/FNR family cyclic AMP-dependent transcriptional regulator